MSRKILVVDDEPDIVRVVVKIMEARGRFYTVTPDHFRQGRFGLFHGQEGFAKEAEGTYSTFSVRKVLFGPTDLLASHDAK